MGLDPEERKIAALFAAFEDINARVEKSSREFAATISRLEPTARQTIHDTLIGELKELHQHIGQTTAQLERMRRAADWRQVLMGAGLTALVVAITLVGFWVVMPSRDELARLRSERDQLQASIDLLASRGGRAQLSKCGASGEHLCVRVEPGLGRYGEGKDYFVIRGY
jgi:hypothetical protein